MKDLGVRTISGFVFISVIIICIWLSPVLFFALLSIILIFSLLELYDLQYKLKFHPYKLYGILAAALSILLIFFYKSNILAIESLWLNVLIFAGLPLFAVLYSPKNFHQSWVSTLLGWFYILLPLELFALMAFSAGSYQPLLIMALFVIIWTYDSFAYLSGVLLGKHKIYPELSPKKSWEGLAGGLIFSLVAAFIFSRFSNLLNLYEWLGLGITLVIFGTIGDFIESALKRNAGVKDSGTFMPGHGGFLDRFDSLFFAIPFVYLYLKFIL